LDKPLTTSDINGDGKIDIILVNMVDANIGILLNIGNGTFNDQITHSASTGLASMIAADINGDNKIDIFVTNAFYCGIYVFLNTGNGTFTDMKPFPFEMSPSEITIADVNDDSKDDIIVVASNAPILGVLLAC
jgi:hypothetical protein